MDKLQDKVKLPKGVMDSIELCKKEGLSNYQIVTLLNVTEKLFRDYDKPTITALETIRDYGQAHEDELFQALVNGYEIEQTPEDQVREMFLLAENEVEMREGQETELSGWWEGRKKGIYDTLNALGKTIEGVNDHE